ncbi:MAG: extracellular solute-binding protein [Bdellovibrio sp.]|nr:extracellular solute-binding protein [Bdellovibrio sp.]
MMKSMILAAAMLFTQFASAATSELTVYSVYDATRLGPVFQPFTERTGIKVNIISGTSDELAQRMKSEGDTSPADILIDKDLVYQGAAQRLDLYRPFASATIENGVPAQFIESSRNWFLIFYRARIIVYNPNKVQESELSTYEALGDSKWQGRLCVRTSANSYNEALGAFFIKHFGPEATLNIFKSWVKNFSVAPIKGDTDVIKAVAAGTCDVGIANSYYLAPLVKADPTFAARPFFPNQNTTGTHINGVGVGLAKHTKNVSEATRLLEYLASAEVQTPVAAAFSQYPTNIKAEMTDILVKFGPYKADATNIGELTPYTNQAKDLMNQAGYK